MVIKQTLLFPAFKGDANCELMDLMVFMTGKQCLVLGFMALSFKWFMMILRFRIIEIKSIEHSGRRQTGISVSVARCKRSNLSHLNESILMSF